MNGYVGINYTSHPINLMRDEQRTDWFMGINPNGLVPVLVHDGEVHIESNDIIEYLDRHFAEPGNSLLPTTAAEQQQMHTLMDLEDQLHPDLRTVTFTYIAPDPSDHAPRLADDDLGYIGRFHDACETLDALLRKRSYLLGERMTLADISWFITLYRLDLAGYPLANHAHLHAYFQRIAQRPAFRRQVSAGPRLIRLAGSIYRRINQRLRHSMPKDFARWQAMQQPIQPN